MNTMPIFLSPARSSNASVVLGLSTLGVGAAVLAGWIWNIESLKTIYGPITMKTNAAIGLMLSGASLVLLRWSPRLSAACAVAAGLIGAATLAEHLTGRDMGIDQLLFTEAPGAAATASPNRMGPNGSLSILLAATSLLLLARGTLRSISTAQKVAFAALVPAALALTGYVYDAQELYGVARYTGIAFNTTLTLAVLHVGILSARPDVAPMSVCVSDGPAGTLLRRLIVPVAVIPVTLGYLEIRGREAEFFDRGLGIALFAVSLIVVLSAILWQTAGAIERTDSDRRQAEAERDRLFELERQARDEAERASRLKDHFIATLSHELRTPLNVMLGWTRMLETGTHPEDAGRVVSVVARNGRLLARLVEDLLDMSRVAVGQIELARSPVAFNALVQACVESIAPGAAEAGVTVHEELDPAIPDIEADAERVQQIVWNLLSNAAKFTPRGGRISITTRSDADSVTLTTTDTGIGFDEEFAAELFQPFRQADPTSRRQHGGLGLGLSIARYLAQLHGGSLTGSSPGAGRGATFVLTLPSMAASRSAAAGREEAAV